jgi:hypothetical protein
MFNVLFPSLKILLVTKFSVNKLVVVAEVIVARSEVSPLKAADKELSRLVTILVAEMLVVVALVIVALVIFALVATKLPVNILVNVGASVKVKATLPNVSVATDKLLEAEINLYKLEIEVVAITPLIVVVSTDPFSLNEEVLELIIDDVETSPFTIEVNSFIT